uniref:FAD-dependent oxidoreductase 2 FAD-binding domain-containing protein n=1 Tax=Mucochytrium quahogii TaxID=96639 RepID=A0A7S2RYX0_9STRA|mmetsp:Transcript_583/g.999  ORF Transcript_583/g.999 Transcript_583/m.999 type:complete len:604 (-) Transcript_583:412-2223(-)|eukprot:CAMPEP_0203749724 /NCGR_PEP_ID=MMETSP0098-20131031/4169_1 /ASSEMBLY_ACC=CAM_ASM_000208 /TAXON_ID=96639 /ORGANISM=" , Strain NY0313808BC1" /LENGTH=603 /DNA_ID=CAMNT_0050638819 /DNA_START=169 /DNA_END=1980 /DNA_ORIENTATION=+
MERIRVISGHISGSESRYGVGMNDVAGIRVGETVDIEEIKRRVGAWRSYLDRVGEKIDGMKGPEGHVGEDEEFDVVVVGFGAAGAAAALDAGDRGKKVLLIDRFDGGGSTRRSGGIYYAGGGTRMQKQLGIDDDVDNMFEYIKEENGGCVSESTIRRFCEESADTFEWLEDRVGVRFKSECGERMYYERKTSYPPSDTTLYQSGNESAYPHCERSRPAPRGHRAYGDYLTGNVFFAGLENAVEAHSNITIRLHSLATEFLMGEGGRCHGVAVNSLPTEGDVEGIHVMLHEIGSGSPMFDPKRTMDRKCRSLEGLLFKKCGIVRNIIARDGVIIACGGFFFNQELVQKFAPKHVGFMPLGNLGDDGTWVEMGQKFGLKFGQLDRCSAWKFINPPYAFVRGILTNQAGERIGNEDVYGASFADFLIQQHQGKGWLLIDHEMWEEANNDCMDPDSGLQPDQRMQGLANLHRNCRTGMTVGELASACGMNRATLEETVALYNKDVENGVDTRFKKNDLYLSKLAKAPYYAINLDMVGNKFWPTPCMSLGGIVVDGDSGEVISEKTGRSVKGLYAAGRSAVGVCSNYYISGLSLADCIFSGRRAGKHV